MYISHFLHLDNTTTVCNIMPTYINFREVALDFLLPSSDENHFVCPFSIPLAGHDKQIQIVSNTVYMQCTKTLMLTCIWEIEWLYFAMSFYFLSDSKKRRAKKCI